MVKEKKEDAYIVAEVWNDMNTYAKYYASGMDSCFDFDFADSTGIIATALRDGKASYYGGSLERVQSLIAEYSENGIDAPFYTTMTWQEEQDIIRAMTVSSRLRWRRQ